ncbi:MAG: hypothetical protein U1D06_01680 [Paracoccaceae bacterium]|nr:hypothetical protein [Paracoccaceae bacterium]
MKHYLRIARTQSNSFWRGLHQQPKAREDGNRRLREYLRIQRGHLA